MELSPNLKQKLVLAGIAVVIALVGMATGLRWLTVAALLLWIGAMIILGTGRRHAPPTPTEE